MKGFSQQFLNEQVVISDDVIFSQELGGLKKYIIENDAMSLSSYSVLGSLYDRNKILKNHTFLNYEVNDSLAISLGFANGINNDLMGNYIGFKILNLNIDLNSNSGNNTKFIGLEDHFDTNSKFNYDIILSPNNLAHFFILENGILKIYDIEIDYSLYQVEKISLNNAYCIGGHNSNFHILKFGEDSLIIKKDDKVFKVSKQNEIEIFDSVLESELLVEDRSLGEWFKVEKSFWNSLISNKISYSKFSNSMRTLQGSW